MLSVVSYLLLALRIDKIAGELVHDMTRYNTTRPPTPN